MPVQKTAISVPARLLSQIDKAANERGESRSRYITRVLEAAVRARRDADVTRRLNELFAHDGVRNEQARAAAELDAVGTDFGEDGW